MSAVKLGIGKTELLTAYYPDELEVIFGILCEANGEEPTSERRVDVMEFLNG